MKTKQLLAIFFSLLITSISLASAKELHYLVEINNHPKGLLIIKPGQTTQVDFVNITANDNLLFYTDQQSFSLANKNLGLNFAPSLGKLKVAGHKIGQDSFSFIYDKATQEKLNLLNLANIATADQNNRAFILNNQQIITENFPKLPVVNTASLLTYLPSVTNNSSQQVYYYEPADNRFLRTLINSPQATKINQSCSVNERLLVLDHEDKKALPLIHFYLGKQHVLQASSASGAWNLKLIAAGENKTQTISLKQQLANLSKESIAQVLPTAQVSLEEIKGLNDLFIVTTTAAYQLTSTDYEKLAKQKLNLTNSQVKLVNENNHLGISENLKPICNNYSKSIAEELVEDIKSQLSNSNLGNKIKGKFKLNTSTNCNTLGLELSLTGVNTDNIAKLNQAFNSSINAFSQNLLLTNELNIETNKKKLNTNLEFKLTDTGLFAYFARQLQVAPSNISNFINDITIENNKLTKQVLLTDLRDQDCLSQAKKLETQLANTQVKVTTNNLNSCNLRISQRLNNTQEIINNFIASQPNLRTLGIQPKIQGSNLVFNGVFAIEGEDNACQN